MSPRTMGHQPTSEEAFIHGSEELLSLLGAGALLVWGLRMVRTGVLRAFGGDLRRSMGRSLRNRFAAFGAGLGITLLLQSSTATALIAASFASHGLVGTGAALAVMLGADVGTSLVAQIFTFLPHGLSPFLILVGVAAFLGSTSTRVRDLGRTVVGLGIMLLALRLISAAAEPMRESPLLPQILEAMQDAPIFAVLFAALLTFLCTSSLAMILLVITLVTAGTVSVPLALAMVLGINLGATFTPLLGTAKFAPEARRVPVANLIFRLVGVAIALPLLPWMEPGLAMIEPLPWREVANFHTLFNVGIALIFLPLIGPVAALCTRLIPAAERGSDPGKPQYLDPAAVESPAVAVANAARETLRMGDIVEKMLRQSLEVFRNDDRKLLREVEGLDDEVDRLHEAIKLYLTEVSREALDKEGQGRSIDVITFTTNLEHVGDIIDKNLMELAAKKIKNRLRFSDEGFAEISTMHQRVCNNLELALNVFVSGDVKLARKLLEEKVVFRELERTASQGHLARLRSGKLESIETSSLHMDVMRDLKRINSHLTSVAYPILDAAGELRQSRLVENRAELDDVEKIP